MNQSNMIELIARQLIQLIELKFYQKLWVFWLVSITVREQIFAGTNFRGRKKNWVVRFSRELIFAVLLFFERISFIFLGIFKFFNKIGKKLWVQIFAILLKYREKAKFNSHKN